MAQATQTAATTHAGSPRYFRFAGRVVCVLTYEHGPPQLSYQPPRNQDHIPATVTAYARTLAPLPGEYKMQAREALGIADEVVA